MAEGARVAGGGAGLATCENSVVGPPCTWDGPTVPDPASYADLLARVRMLLAQLDRTPVVGISGHGGSGKTTLAAGLAVSLGFDEEQVVSTDCFYARGAGPGSGLDDLHDWPALIELLHRVRASPRPSRLTYPVRMWDGGEGRCDVALPPVVLVEGIRLLRPLTRPVLDLAVWIDLPPEIAARRALRRNRAQGDSAAELDLWHTKWIPEGIAYARAVEPEGLADLVLPAAGPRGDEGLA